MCGGQTSGEKDMPKIYKGRGKFGDTNRELKKTLHYEDLRRKEEEFL